MTVQKNEFIAYSLETIRMAVSDYFAPLVSFCGWLGQFAKLPRRADHLIAIEVMLKQTHKQTNDLNKALAEHGERIQRAIEAIKRDLSEVRGIQKNEVAQSFENIQKQLDSVIESELNEMYFRKLLEFGKFEGKAQIQPTRSDLSRQLGVNIGRLVELRPDENYFKNLIELGKTQLDIWLFPAGTNARLSLDSQTFRALVGSALTRRALVDYSQHRYQTAASLTERAIEVFERTGDRGSLTQSYIQLISILYSIGEPDEARKVLKKAQERSGLILDFEIPFHK